MPFAGDEHPVGALAPDGPHPALRESVRRRGLWRYSNYVDARGGEDRVEGGGELRIVIAEQEPEPVGALVEADEQVPCLLRDPGTGRVCGDTDDVDVAGGELDEEQYGDPFQRWRR
ncbi:hypothetical protein AB0K00_57710 [Dactylosporangium sp. NPDC049525]|uniref:hypothetical protein n=1 Tax=Dactylosporangium sp. NPDC049525 TaxID=3154730 RepID=UPI00343AE90D